MLCIVARRSRHSVFAILFLHFFCTNYSSAVLVSLSDSYLWSFLGQVFTQILNFEYVGILFFIFCMSIINIHFCVLLCLFNFDMLCLLRHPALFLWLLGAINKCRSYNNILVILLVLYSCHNIFSHMCCVEFRKESGDSWKQVEPLIIEYREAIDKLIKR